MDNKLSNFTYNKVTFNINDIILLKYKSRLVKYTISRIELKEDCHLIKFVNYDYNYITKNVKFPLKTSHKYIKKFHTYTEPVDILCTIYQRQPTVYKIQCDFCNTIHKHNYLGHQDCRCNSPYSPYYNNGYNLILDRNQHDFNDYLLYNFELYLQKNNFNGWSSYKLSVKKFCDGSICGGLGITKFPYITPNTIEYIKLKYKDDNKLCSNGCLIAGLANIIKMVLSKTLLYNDDFYKSDINKLYKFYKNNNNNILAQENLKKIKSLVRILNTYKKDCLLNLHEHKTDLSEELQKKIEIENTDNIDKIDKIENIDKIDKIDKIENDIDSSDTELIYDDNMNIHLDLDCGLEQIEKLSLKHIDNIKTQIHKDFPHYQDKYFYLPDDVKIYSKYLNIYDDMWLCITKLESNISETIFCVDEVNDYDPDFINHRLELREQIDII